MHAIDGFRRPRPETLMTNDELSRIETPMLFYWGRDDPFLSPQRARPSVAKIPGAILHEVDGGHAPWFENPVDCSTLIDEHQRARALSGEQAVESFGRTVVRLTATLRPGHLRLHVAGLAL